MLCYRLLGFLVALVFLASAVPVQALEPPSCIESPSSHYLTGYVKGDPHLSNRTADGTSIWSGEWLVASTTYPFGAVIWIEDLGYFRVADRGDLGPRHLDVLVDSYGQAYQLTGWRQACRVQ